MVEKQKQNEVKSKGSKHYFMIVGWSKILFHDRMKTLSLCCGSERSIFFCQT